jgi:hypothetical protein
MNLDSYIKHKPIEYANKVAELEDLLPYYTEHLNTLTLFFGQIQNIRRFLKSNNFTEQDKEFEEMEAQLHFNLLLTIGLLDLIVISKNILSAKHVWEEIYYLRQSYLTIYETLKTYQDHSKSIRSLANKNSKNSKDLFDTITSQIKEFKKAYSYNSTIADIRNYTIGHIDSDCIKFFDKISSLNTEKAIDATITFASLLIKMQELSKNIASEANQEVKKKTSEINMSINSYVIKISELFDKLDEKLKT